MAKTRQLGGSLVQSLKVRYRALRIKIASVVRTNREFREEALRATIHRIYWSAPAMALANLAVAISFSFKEELPFSIEEWSRWLTKILSLNYQTGAYWMS